MLKGLVVVLMLLWRARCDGGGHLPKTLDTAMCPPAKQQCHMVRTLHPTRHANNTWVHSVTVAVTNVTNKSMVPLTPGVSAKGSASDGAHQARAATVKVSASSTVARGQTALCVCVCECV